MIIGKNKNIVINNIKKAIENEEFNKKVEVDDPKISKKQKEKIINRYLSSKGTIKYKCKNKVAMHILKSATRIINKDTKIDGIENIKNIKTGAIITSNHFNPLDNTIVRKTVNKAGKKKLYIVSQETNLAMNGFIGFLMNYTDVIPISNQIGYMKKDFPKMIKEKLQENNIILIYPEEEMWFNYRKPRPLKVGAYYFAAKNNVPIISCFVEIKDKQEKDNDEFYKVQYIMHVLKPIYPDTSKSVKENSKIMMEQDFNQKKECYEKVYNKKLNYNFEKGDIAGLIEEE